MDVGKLFPVALDLLLKTMLPIQTVRELYYSIEINAKEALEKQVITDLCQNGKHLDATIEDFISTYAPKAWNRKVLSEIKQRVHSQILYSCKTDAFGPLDFYFGLKPLRLPPSKKVAKSLTKKVI